MKSFYFISLLISLSFISIKGEDAANFRLNYPKLIPINTSFDISLVTRNVEPDADKLTIYISGTEKIDLKQTILRTPFQTINIPFTKLQENTGQKYSYKIDFNLKDSLLLPGIYFQILYTFKGDGNNDIEIIFTAEYQKDENTLRTIPSSASKDFLQEPFNTATISFYTPNNYAGRALNLKDNSQLLLGFENVTSSNTLIDFWIKFKNKETSFLSLQSKTNSLQKYVAGINNFQMISITPYSADRTSLQQRFISKNVWYHFSVQLDFLNRLLKIYVNGKLTITNNLEFIKDINDLQINFSGMEKEKIFFIEQLRIFDLKNVIETSFLQKHYKDAQLDSSRIIARFNFDDLQSVNRKRDKLNVSTQNIELSSSDAPIFQRSPELNVTVWNSVYQLEWYGGDFRQALRYILERTETGDNFLPVFRIDADRTTEKKYTYSDTESDAGIVYYRVRQVNQDGSFVFSPVVKIGQGEIEPFLIRQNYPNPFNPLTSITIEMIEEAFVEIIVYNLVGSELERLHEGYLSKGIHSFSFDGTQLPSGIYLYTVSTTSFSQTKKMILAK